MLPAGATRVSATGATSARLAEEDEGPQVDVAGRERLAVEDRVRGQRDDLLRDPPVRRREDLPPDRVQLLRLGARGPITTRSPPYPSTGLSTSSSSRPSTSARCSGIPHRYVGTSASSGLLPQVVLDQPGHVRVHAPCRRRRRCPARWRARAARRAPRASSGRPERHARRRPARAAAPPRPSAGRSRRPGCGGPPGPGGRGRRRPAGRCSRPAARPSPRPASGARTRPSRPGRSLSTTTAGSSAAAGAAADAAPGSSIAGVSSTGSRSSGTRQLGQHAPGEPPVLHRVPEPGGHPQVVLQHVPAAVGVADQVDAGHLGAHACAGRSARRWGAAPATTSTTQAGTTPSRDHGPVAVDVVQERVERAGALHQPGPQRPPVGGGHDPRHQVDREQPGGWPRRPR